MATLKGGGILVGQPLPPAYCPSSPRWKSSGFVSTRQCSCTWKAAAVSSTRDGLSSVRATKHKPRAVYQSQSSPSMSRFDPVKKGELVGFVFSYPVPLAMNDGIIGDHQLEYRLPDQLCLVILYSRSPASA